MTVQNMYLFNTFYINCLWIWNMFYLFFNFTNVTSPTAHCNLGRPVLTLEKSWYTKGAVNRKSLGTTGLSNLIITYVNKHIQKVVAKNGLNILLHAHFLYDESDTWLPLNLSRERNYFWLFSYGPLTFLSSAHLEKVKEPFLRWRHPF
jgi:hypothetical protein